MQQVHEQGANSNSAFAVVGVAFIAMVGVAIGLVFYFHSERVKLQKALYADYVTFNAWREPSRTAYAKLSPILDELDQINPANETTPSHLNGLFREFHSAAAPLLGISSGVIPPGVSMPAYERDLCSAEDTYFYSVRACAAYQKGKAWRAAVNSRVSNLIMSDWYQARMSGVEGTSFRYSAAVERAKLKEFAARVAKLNDADVKTMLMRYKEVDHASALASRKAVEKFLTQPEIVPRGLDLEYARRLK